MDTLRTEIFTLFVMVSAISGLIGAILIYLYKKLWSLTSKFDKHIADFDDAVKGTEYECNNANEIAKECLTRVNYLRGDFESLKHDFNLHNHKYVFEGNILYIKEPNEVD
jgi:hypothetical protein